MCEGLIIGTGSLSYIDRKFDLGVGIDDVLLHSPHECKLVDLELDPDSIWQNKAVFISDFSDMDYIEGLIFELTMENKRDDWYAFILPFKEIWIKGSKNLEGVISGLERVTIVKATDSNGVEFDLHVESVLIRAGAVAIELGNLIKISLMGDDFFYISMDVKHDEA